VYSSTTKPADSIHRVFLLSPASCGGKRAQLLFSEGASFDLARRIRAKGGAPLGEVFSFLSGLYFRGKLTYARRFARPPEGAPGVLVITPNDGLETPELSVDLRKLKRFAEVDIHQEEERYRRPLLKDARALARRLGSSVELVLLGSVATGKYVDVLLDIFTERLRFPRAFVGRGDMSRGGLMLRCVAETHELEYVPVKGAVRHGARPPKLPSRSTGEGRA
jgi:hypothetical protein